MALQQENIPTSVHYPAAIHQQPAFKNMIRIAGAVRHSEYLAKHVFSLPMHPYLETADIEKIATILLQNL